MEKTCSRLLQCKQQTSDSFTTNSASKVNEHDINSNHQSIFIFHSKNEEDLVSETVGAKLVDDLYTLLEKDRMEIEKAIHETEEPMR